MVAFGLEPSTWLPVLIVAAAAIAAAAWIVVAARRRKTYWWTSIALAGVGYAAIALSSFLAGSLSRSSPGSPRG